MARCLGAPHAALNLRAKSAGLTLKRIAKKLKDFFDKDALQYFDLIWRDFLSSERHRSLDRRAGREACTGFANRQKSCAGFFRVARHKFKKLRRAAVTRGVRRYVMRCKNEPASACGVVVYEFSNGRRVDIRALVEKHSRQKI
jgi:hypothetical protein